MHPIGYNINNKVDFIPYRVFFYNMELSAFLKKIRKQRKFTQQDFAERAGVGLRFVCELEHEKVILHVDKVNLYCCYLAKNYKYFRKKLFKDEDG